MDWMISINSLVFQGLSCGIRAIRFTSQTSLISRCVDWNCQNFRHRHAVWVNSEYWIPLKQGKIINNSQILIGWSVCLWEEFSVWGKLRKTGEWECKMHTIAGSLEREHKVCEYVQSQGDHRKKVSMCGHVVAEMLWKHYGVHVWNCTSAGCVYPFVQVHGNRGQKVQGGCEWMKGAGGRLTSIICHLPSFLIDFVGGKLPGKVRIGDHMTAWYCSWS